MTHLDQIGWERGREGRKTRFEKRVERERERLNLISKFIGNRTSGFRRSKRKSSPSRQGLRIETAVGGVGTKNLGGRFFPTLITFYPKGCVVVVLP